MRNLFQKSALMSLVVIMAACGNTLADDEIVGKDEAAATTTVTAIMSADRLAGVIKSLDKDAEESANRVVFKVRERELMAVYDKEADRMRIVTPIIQAAAVPEEIHARMLQANFDAVLDSRYAIANEIVWSVFIHRLSTLTEDDLKSGIAQAYSAAETFGSTYTSGVIVFGGGDSNSLHEELLEEFENRPAEEDQGI